MAGHPVAPSSHTRFDPRVHGDRELPDKKPRFVRFIKKVGEKVGSALHITKSDKAHRQDKTRQESIHITMRPPSPSPSQGGGGLPRPNSNRISSLTPSSSMSSMSSFQADDGPGLESDPEFEYVTLRQSSPSPKHGGGGLPSPDGVRISSFMSSPPQTTWSFRADDGPRPTQSTADLRRASLKSGDYASADFDGMQEGESTARLVDSDYGDFRGVAEDRQARERTTASPRGLDEPVYSKPVSKPQRVTVSPEQDLAEHQISPRSSSIFATERESDSPSVPRGIVGWAPANLTDPAVDEPDSDIYTTDSSLNHGGSLNEDPVYMDTVSDSGSNPNSGTDSLVIEGLFSDLGFVNSISDPVVQEHQPRHSEPQPSLLQHQKFEAEREEYLAARPRLERSASLPDPRVGDLLPELRVDDPTPIVRPKLPVPPWNFDRVYKDQALDTLFSVYGEESNEKNRLMKLMEKTSNTNAVSAINDFAMVYSEMLKAATSEEQYEQIQNLGKQFTELILKDGLGEYSCIGTFHLKTEKNHRKYLDIDHKLAKLQQKLFGHSYTAMGDAFAQREVMPYIEQYFEHTLNTLGRTLKPEFFENVTLDQLVHKAPYEKHLDLRAESERLFAAVKPHTAKLASDLASIARLPKLLRGIHMPGDKPADGRPAAEPAPAPDAAGRRSFAGPADATQLPSGPLFGGPIPPGGITIYGGYGNVTNNYSNIGNNSHNTSNSNNSEDDHAKLSETHGAAAARSSDASQASSGLASHISGVRTGGLSRTQVLESMHLPGQAIYSATGTRTPDAVERNSVGTQTEDDGPGLPDRRSIGTDTDTDTDTGIDTDTDTDTDTDPLQPSEHYVSSLDVTLGVNSEATGTRASRQGLPYQTAQRKPSMSPTEKNSMQTRGRWPDEVDGKLSGGQDLRFGRESDASSSEFGLVGEENPRRIFSRSERMGVAGQRAGVYDMSHAKGSGLSQFTSTRELLAALMESESLPSESQAIIRTMSTINEESLEELLSEQGLTGEQLIRFLRDPSLVQRSNSDPGLDPRKVKNFIWRLVENSSSADDRNLSRNLEGTVVPELEVTTASTVTPSMPASLQNPLATASLAQTATGLGGRGGIEDRRDGTQARLRSYPSDPGETLRRREPEIPPGDRDTVVLPGRETVVPPRRETVVPPSTSTLQLLATLIESYRSSPQAEALLRKLSTIREESLEHLLREHGLTGEELIAVLDESSSLLRSYSDPGQVRRQVSDFLRDLENFPSADDRALSRNLEGRVAPGLKATRESIVTPSMQASSQAIRGTASLAQTAGSLGGRGGIEDRWDGARSTLGSSDETVRLREREVSSGDLQTMVGTRSSTLPLTKPDGFRWQTAAQPATPAYASESSVPRVDGDSVDPQGIRSLRPGAVRDSQSELAMIGASKDLPRQYDSGVESLTSSPTDAPPDLPMRRVAPTSTREVPLDVQPVDLSTPKSIDSRLSKEDQKIAIARGMEFLKYKEIRFIPVRPSSLSMDYISSKGGQIKPEKEFLRLALDVLQVDPKQPADTPGLKEVIDLRKGLKSYLDGKSPTDAEGKLKLAADGFAMLSLFKANLDLQKRCSKAIADQGRNMERAAGLLDKSREAAALRERDRHQADMFFLASTLAKGVGWDYEQKVVRRPKVEDDIVVTTQGGRRSRPVSSSGGGV